MARLIDADVLVEEIKQDERILQLYVLSKINAQPTVEERNKGKWEGLNQHGFFARKYRCTACESVVDMGCYTRGCDYDYCPYCGAEITVEE